MTRGAVAKITSAAALTLSLSLFLAVPSQAQDARERDIKIKIGKTPTDIKLNHDVQLWAVLIGISRYKYGDQNVGGYEIKNLKNAADDAQAIYEFLRSEEGGGFPEDHIILLKDENATKAQVEAALAKLKQTRPDDFFMLFIAAHGVLAPQYDESAKKTVEVPYFVMYDSDLRDMAHTGLPMETFQKAVREIPAKKGLVLSDTCHSAGVQLAGRGADATTRANSILTERLKEADATGVGFLWAADQTEISFEYDNLSQGQGQGQGVFTYCVLEALRGNADADADGLVTFLELKNYVRDKVPELTNRQQHPGGNSTSVDTNYIPLSAVPGTCKSRGDCGSIVIRAPEMENVAVAIDGQEAGTVSSRHEITRRAPGGDRLLVFKQGGTTLQRYAKVEPGKTKFVEINRTFTQSDEDALVPPPDTQVNVYFSEEKAPSNEAKDAFLDGVDLFNRQDMEKAVQKFNEAITKNGGVYADAFVYRGRAEQSLGRKVDAIKSFQLALAARKTDFEAETLLAEAKFNLNQDPSEVEPMLRSIIKRHPNWDFPRVVLGDVLLKRAVTTDPKYFIDSERELRKAIKINPKSPPAHLILADVLMHQGSVAKMKEAVEEAKTARDQFEEISKKKVSATRALKGLSISHLIFGGGRFRNDAAAAEVHHKVGEAITRLAYYDDTGADYSADLDLARQELTAAKQYAKDDKTRLALVLQTSALNYLLKGDLKRAIEDGEAALKLRNDLAEAHFYLSQAYKGDQKFAPAAEHLTRYIAMSKPVMSADDLKKFQEELDDIVRKRDANRQKK
ncbi:MAG TPA: caspase family protein [Blastocatellia bacterium]|nr:caspase family protein [Blastocatellia bacterium]